MSSMQLIFLAAIQGLTEFLPVSSSGHLILFSHMTGFQDQGIGIDIALHIGSLLAVIIYFRSMIVKMFLEVLKTKLIPNFSCIYNKLAYLVVAASIPALFVGFLLRNFDMDFLRNPKIIGVTILCYGLLLYFADRFSENNRNLKDITLKDAVLIGLAQCLALVPGTSRSGITITIARFLKINRVDSAKFSMLLSIPTIFAAGVLEIYRLLINGLNQEIYSYFDSVLYSFAASYIVIYFMMKWLQNKTYLPFVVYRIILGMLLICFSW